ncbi:putative RNA 2'-phosphotransferase [Lactobacillus rhamnosus DSM] [Lacticaseibacillus rhamnosus]|nr:putative RNA 2'-phosphotransferase [Lactobacillus rhamnosus DSM] [Lacticaseibacillus rhamnosus]
MNRDFVHLSSDLDMAKQVGSRHDAHPVIFRIDALAHSRRAHFFTPLVVGFGSCLLYTSPSPRDVEESRMPSSA